MTGEWQGFRRLRIGEYRIIYLVNSEAQLIKVVRVGPRGSVYD
jgi:mRNA interferase RelE/StbE